MRTLLSTLLIVLAFASSAQDFGPRQQISHGFLYAPYDVHCADLDGDGDLDVLSASFEDDKIAWMENLGDTFGSPQSISENADGALSVYAADFDGDGDLDVVSGSKTDDKVAWYENDGAGNFSEEQLLNHELVRVERVHAADLDGDGDMDILAVASWWEHISWFENDGSGNFTDEIIINQDGGAPHAIFTADFDGDGDLDVLSTAEHNDFGDVHVAWYENGGNGNFDDDGPYFGANLISETVYSITSVYAADFDGDGDMDVLSASEASDDIIWYENDGAGNFTEGAVLNYGANNVQSVFAADLDGDGDMDVLSASRSDNIPIAWYENDGEGNFSSEVMLGLGANQAMAVYAADMDGDGDTDVLAAYEGSNMIALYENDGSANFSDEIRVNPEFNSTYSVYAADLNGDTNLDVLSAAISANTVGWYENDGVGQFSTEQIVSSETIEAQCVYASDLDGDGDLDMLSASYDDDKIAWYQNDGSGTFSSEIVINSMANGAASVYASDLDGDGDMDVLSTSYIGDQIGWYENDGSGNFSDENTINADANGASSVFATDIDGDGDMDVLSSTFVSDDIAWYENDGNGNFSSENVINSSANGAECVFAADLDGDGDMDVLSASKNDDKIIWYENDGSGSFSSVTIITDDADQASSVFACDLDNDGDMDVLSTSVYDDKLAWYENDGSGVFSSEKIIDNVARNPRGVFAADLDGDGDNDVVSASFFGHAWYENLMGEGCTDPGACNFNPNVWVEDGSCCYDGCGCMDEIAENYNPDATCPSNLCEYIEGCSSQIATNYNPEVTLDDGSCLFQFTGLVFNDENENGILDGSETGLPFQSVTVEPFMSLLITNDDGMFTFELDSAQAVSFTENFNPDFPFNTTFPTINFNPETATSTYLEFGISIEQPSFGIDVDLYSSPNGFLCNGWAIYSVGYRNMGNVPVDGVVEFEYDLLYQDHDEISLIDSVNGNTVYMSFENLMPGQMYLYDVLLLNPTADYLGEFVTIESNVTGFFQGGQVAYGEEALEMEVTCAYDPNDKHAFPQGYTDEHWLLQETEQEFLIRFQNTGNAPAQNVRIQDTLDVNFDLETFKLVANSHSVMTTINPQTRLIDFYFEDIQLPDSVNNEPESHGLITYKITPLPNLPIGTVLENTAYIYFDNNDPIITNTTWTTIHECGGEAVYAVEEVGWCNGAFVEFAAMYPFLDSYTWTFDEEEVADENFGLTVAEATPYNIIFSASNPLCTESTSFVYEVVDFSDLDPCVADFTCDGQRNSADLISFLSDFGCQIDCDKDLNTNGAVEAFDLMIFLSLFNQDCWE